MFSTIIQSTETQELFSELFFGTGAWLGLLIILSIAFIVGYKYRYASAPFILILIFMGWNYLEEIGGQISLDNNFAWAFIITMVSVIALSGKLLKDVGIRK